MQRMIFVLVMSVIACGSAIDFASAQSSTRQSLHEQVVECFEKGDYKGAVTLLERQLRRSPNDPTAWYNLACAHSRLNDLDAAATALHRALKAGFDDIEHMRRDPDLAAMREHPVYRTIFLEADRASSRRGTDAMAHWREVYGENDYRYETDKDHRLNFATALDETSHNEMREMLAEQADQMIHTLFEQAQGYDVLIAVPTPADSDRFFKDRSIGGIYQHNLRRLVARDIGASLRHEFFHALHYGHMERLGQPHALWVQEGMASLYEEYDLAEDGTITFLPNDRQLIMKSRARAGILLPWKDLFALTSEEFMEKATHMYPMARSIFEYVAAKDALEPWYQAYVKHFDVDRTGAKAFEVAFAKTLDEVEKDWRKWVASQPAVNFNIRPENAALGIRTDDHGSNDGVLITQVVYGSAASRAGLKRGDVIVAIDDRTTRSLLDLRKIVASKNTGDEIIVRARRKAEYFTATVVLRPLPGV